MSRRRWWFIYPRFHPSRGPKASISHLRHWESLRETSHNIACVIDSLKVHKKERAHWVEVVWVWWGNAAVLFLVATALSIGVSPCQAQTIINMLSARHWHEHALGTALERFSKTCTHSRCRLLSLFAAICYFGACWGKYPWRSHCWQEQWSAGVSYMYSKLSGFTIEEGPMIRHSYVLRICFYLRKSGMTDVGFHTKHI